MPPKTVIELAAVVEAAIRLLRKGGWAAVTARAIAELLGSSTMPIYSSIGSMDRLRDLAERRAEELLYEYQRRPFTDNETMNLAVGYVAFAQEEPRLFDFLFKEAAAPLSLEEAMDKQTSVGVDKLPSVRELLGQVGSAADADEMLFCMWTFTHGLASLVSGGVVKLDQERIVDLLRAAGEAFFLQKTRKGGK